MRKLVVMLGLLGTSVALFGTSANADPPVIARPIVTAKRADPSPPPADPPGKVTVKYGIWGGGMTSREMNAADWYQCANLMFPGDPAPNQKKACYLANGTKLAYEGQIFTTPGPECVRVNVKYVAVNGATKDRNFCPGRQATCSNAVFGVDPAVGVVKHCEIAGHQVAAENKDFETPASPTPYGNCLCGATSVAELRLKNGVIKDAIHD